MIQIERCQIRRTLLVAIIDQELASPTIGSGKSELREDGDRNIINHAQCTSDKGSLVLPRKTA